MISIVFDLDGTLADTSRDMLKAANLCFKEMGYSDVLSEGQIVKVKVLDVDQRGRVKLTMKDLEESQG